MSKDVLEENNKKKIEKVDLLKKSISLNALNEQIDQNKTFINFKDKIQNNIDNNKISLIAEIKKASPSAGIIIDDYNPIEIAKIYDNNKVTCLSILTEEDFFLGNLSDISKVKEKITNDTIGTPHLINITSRDPGPPPLEYIKTSGGLFLDMAIHDFDMACHLMDDEVESVYASATVFGAAAIEELGDIDTAITTLTFKKGGMACINNSRNSSYGYDQRVEVFGSKGMTGANNKTLDKHYSADESGFHTPVLLDFFLERYADSYRIELIAFIESFIQQTSSPISASEGLKSMLISLAAKKSIQKKRVVTLTEMMN